MINLFKRMLFVLAYMTALIVESVVLGKCNNQSKQCIDHCFDRKDLSARDGYPMDTTCKKVCMSGFNSICWRCAAACSNGICDNYILKCLKGCPDENTCMPTEPTFRHLISKLQQNGITTQFKEILQTGVSLDVATLSAVIYNIYENTSFVGEAYLLNGPMRHICFATVEDVTKSFISLFFLNDLADHLQQVKFDQQGNIISEVEEIHSEPTFFNPFLSCGEMCRFLISTGKFKSNMLTCIAGCFMDCAKKHILPFSSQ
jgi:hypothetical protein